MAFLLHTHVFFAYFVLAQIHIFFTYFDVGSNKDLSIFTGVEIWKMKSPERQLVWTPTLTMRSCVSVFAHELYEELYEEAR